MCHRGLYTYSGGEVEVASYGSESFGVVIYDEL